MNHTRRRTAGRVRRTTGQVPQRDDRGSTLVEAAIAMPLFMFLLFAIIEFSGLMLSYSSTSNTAHAGGRIAAIAANSPNADLTIMKRMAGEAAALGAGELDYVILWHATGSGDTVPAACKSLADAAGTTANQTSLGVDTGTATGGCNIYVAPQASNGAFKYASLPLSVAPATPTSANGDYYFGCDHTAKTAHQLDCNWPGSLRYATDPGVLPASQQLPDYIGVYVKAHHPSFTGLIVGNTTITRQVIVPLEPQDYST